MPLSFSSPLDLATIRQAFPALAELTYLNVGTYGLMPEPALAELMQAVTAFERYGVASPIDLDGKMNETRAAVARLLGADPGEIAFTRNATDGVNLVLAGIDWRPGDEVITSTEEHPAIAHPLLYLQRRREVRIRTVEVSPKAAEMTARLDGVLSSRTRLLAISQVPCETGARLPAREMATWAAAHGVLSLIDGAQALGTFPINVREIGCDYYTSNGHKWLCGPKGTGIFYARRERLAGLSPAHVGAGSLERADMGTGEAEPWLDGRRFEFGTRAWPLYAGLGASLAWVGALGWDRIEQHMAALSAYLKERVARRPYLHLLTPRDWAESSGLTSFSMDGQQAPDLAATLRTRWRIHVRVVTHYNAIRVATAFFNNREDIDRLLAALDELAG